ncbi:MAG: cell division protein FtsH, partial [Sedimentibacter sp.]
PGRFDRQIEIMLPDKNARKEILNLYISKMNASNDIDLEEIADLTVYFSGAMIENLINEAALLAIRENSEQINNYHIQKSYLEILAGAEKKNVSENTKQKITTSYHEAGHAFVSKYLMPENKIMRVSVIPTSKGAGGYTLSIPEGTEVVTKTRIRNQLAVLMAGRVAEEVFFGKENVTTGAQNDIERSTDLAVDYISQYGMDENSVFVNFRVLSEKLNIPLTSVEQSVKKLTRGIYEEVVELIINNKEKVYKIANLLIEKEVIFDKDLNELL